MEMIYAALLLHSAGKPIDEEHLTKVLEATGEKPDPAKVKSLVASLEGVNIDEVISQAPAVAAAPSAAAPAEEKKEEKKEEEKKEDEEKKAEEAAAGLSSLFG